MHILRFFQDKLIFKMTNYVEVLGKIEPYSKTIEIEGDKFID